MPDRRQDDPWREKADEKLKNLDDGQLHIIKRLDEQDDILKQQSKLLKNGTDLMQQLLDETIEVRRITNGARWGGRIMRAGGRALHLTAKWLAPILAAAVTLWALWVTFITGRPPPP